MHAPRRTVAVVSSGALAALVLVTGALGSPAASTATTAVAVTAGKPVEFKFTLSKTVVAPGTVVFRITNRGQITHDFKIAGKTSAKLARGKSGTLRAVFKKPGRYTFLCTLPGHAAAGMKGVLVVRKPTPVAVAAGKPSELKFTVSKTQLTKGPVAFKVTNSGRLTHDFKIAGVRTAKLAPGKTATLNVTFAKPGRYAFLCTIPGHAAAGMKGTIVVK